MTGFPCAPKPCCIIQLLIGNCSLAVLALVRYPFPDLGKHWSVWDSNSKVLILTRQGFKFADVTRQCLESLCGNKKSSHRYKSWIMLIWPKWALSAGWAAWAFIFQGAVNKMLAMWLGCCIPSFSPNDFNSEGHNWQQRHRNKAVW